MAKKLPFFATESGTWRTTAPDPHIDLSGNAVALAGYPVRTFAAAAADTDTDFASGDSIAVLVVIDAANWARYSGVVWTDASPDVLDFSNATLEADGGTIPADAGVSVYSSELRGPPSDITLDGYIESGVTGVASTAGALTVNLDGRNRVCTLTEDVALDVTPPTAPLVGDTRLTFVQVAANYAVTYPLEWLWKDGAAVDMPTGAGSRLNLTITSTPDGLIEVEGVVMRTAPRPPVAVIGGPYTGTVGQVVFFDGTGSYDLDGTIETYNWNFGDTTTAQGDQVQHTYSTDGVFTVVLEVIDDDGFVDTAETTCTVALPNQDPVAVVNGPYSGTAGIPIDFSSAGSNDPDGTIVQYYWTFGDGDSSYAQNPSKAYAGGGNFTVTLTVTDNDGAVDQDSTTCAVDATTLELELFAQSGTLMETQVVGDNTFTTTRTVAQKAVDSTGDVIVEYGGSQMAWEGGRAGVDPARLFFEGTVTASTPDPLAVFYATVGAGNTWRTEYENVAGDVIVSDPLLTSVTQGYRPEVGGKIRVYLPSNCTLFQCQNSQLAFTLPADFTDFPSLANLNMAANDLSGTIPALSNLFNQFKVQINQLTGNIPTLAGQTSLTAFYVQTNSLTGVEGGWTWPTGQAMDFNASDNALSSAAVDAILIAANSALPSGVGTTINLSGGTNGIPSASGLAAASSLIGKGATVTVNS